MLTIKNVSASLGAKEIIKNINIKVGPGEVHALIGPKRSGKSTLAHLISGHPALTQTEGTVSFKNKNLAKLNASGRAKLGIYTTFQHPPEIQGQKNIDIVLNVLRSKKDKRSDQEIEKDYKVLATMLELRPNHGSLLMDYDVMSPSEFRKNELLQMLMFDPDLVIIDEVDLDMDDDELASVGAVLSSFVDDKKSMILITNNKKLLEMVTPDNVHLMAEGEIKANGGPELYKRIVEE